jgi:O-antigen/teichoic acid export membrane protein
MFAFSAFQLAWPQYAFQIASDPQAGRTFARLTRYIAMGGGMVFLLLSLFAREWVGLLAGGKFQAAHHIIPVVSLAHLGYAAYFLFATGITIKERTSWLPLITGISAVVNLAGNILLIPKYGPLGAAWATFLGYTMLAILTYLFSNHYLPVPYEFRSMGKIAGVVICLWLLPLCFPFFSYGLNLAGRIVLCAASMGGFGGGGDA